MVLTFIKQSPFIGVYNGYILISEDEPFYQNHELDLDEDYFHSFGLEETTLQSFITTEDAERFMDNNVVLPYPRDSKSRWMLIGFDSLHYMDNAMTQNAVAVAKRVEAWYNAFKKENK